MKNKINQNIRSLYKKYQDVFGLKNTINDLSEVNLLILKNKTDPVDVCKSINNCIKNKKRYVSTK
mgnify:CR=1 FL=1|tara:strand:+ start:1678 stop:1872 length:195 start_codon:yes stop_codon:yes gene_type:complete